MRINFLIESHRELDVEGSVPKEIKRIENHRNKDETVLDPLDLKQGVTCIVALLGFEQRYPTYITLNTFISHKN